MGDWDTEQLIDAWLDGEVSAEQAAEIERRLRSDPRLRREYGPMLALLREPEAVDVPADLRERVVAAVRERAVDHGVVKAEGGRWHRVSNRLAWVGAMAASIALFLAGWFYAQTGKQIAGPKIDSEMAMVTGPDGTVASPGMAVAFAQSVTARGLAYPVPFVVQGAVIELLAEREYATAGPTVESVGRRQSRPVNEGRGGPAGATESENRSAPALVLPIIQRL